MLKNSPYASFQLPTQDRKGITKISSQRCFTQFDGSLCNGSWGHSPNSGHGQPKGSDDATIVKLGFGTIDAEKPVILCIGHKVAHGAGIMDYLEDEGLEEDVEVCGICCAARYNPVQQERQGYGPPIKTA